MKILLLGEFSALNQNLKEGLLKLGHDVVLLADGDGWKQINESAQPLYQGSGDYRKIIDYLSNFKNFDVVQCVGPVLFKRTFNNQILKRVQQNNRIFVLNAAGDNSIVYNAYLHHKYRYFVYDNDDKWERLYGKKYVKGFMRSFLERQIFLRADGIIPTAYEYAEAFRLFPNCRRSILLPISCDKVKYKDNIILNNKILFFHGINRPLSKGSNYIITAMKKLKEKYPNDVDIIINDRMPLSEYLKVMSKVNVVLDQCKVYSRGMNALYAMAEGKIVMGGNEPEDAKEFKIEPSPIINIIPDENQIYNEMIKILENKQYISEWGYKSRVFVEEHHDSSLIASQYVNEWRNIQNGN